MQATCAQGRCEHPRTHAGNRTQALAFCVAHAHGVTRYLKAVERSQERFNLDGEVAGEVTAEQREHAATTLKERFAAQAKQHREKRAAEEEKRAAEEAEKRRGEKLQQLVSKFGR